MVRYIFALICTTALSVAAAVVGLYLPPLATLWKVLAIVCAVCMVGICIANLIADHRQVDRYVKMTERQRRDYGLRVKEEIERDYKAAVRRVWASVVCGYVYLGIFVVLCMIGIACLTALGVTGAIVAFAIPVLGLFMRLFAKTEEYVPEFGLNKGEYPLLYAIAYKAQRAVGSRGKVVIHLDDSLEVSVGVSETHGYVYIWISPIFYAISTDEELYAAFLHEFGHIKNHDTRRSRRFYWQKAFWLRDESLGSSLFISFIATVIGKKIYEYEWISARYYEKSADLQVRQFGMEQPFINAVAKVEELSIYFNMFRRETMYDCLAAEKPVSDYVSLELATYEVYRVKWAEIWNQILTNRLAALVDSHPSLRQRMEALGVKAYDASQRETKPDACAERKKMLELADRKNMKSLADGYEELRQEDYLKPKSIMEEYCKAESEGTQMPLTRLKDCPKAFYGIDNERALKISEELIAQNYYASIGHFTLGQLFYHRMDSRCMQEFRAAMSEKPDMYEDCLERMANFALRTGDEELISQYREESVDLAQQAKDILKATNWFSKKAPLRQSALSQELIEGLCQRVKAQGNAVRSLYVADYGKEITVTAVVIDTSVPAQGKRWNEIFDDVIDYLNAFPLVAAYIDIRGKGVARALDRAKIQPVFRQ